MSEPNDLGREPNDLVSEPIDDELPQGADDFAEVLREAVRARGLSLDRLRSELGRLGVRISVATLSYWQTGRSRPERATSLAAIGPLEQVLGVPRGHLASRLDYRPEGGGAAREYVPGRVEEVLPPDWGEAGRAFAELGLWPDDGVARVSIHDRLFLGADGAPRTGYVRSLLRGTRDGVDRYPVWVDHVEPGSVPTITPELNCRLGRVSTPDPEAGIAAEILLARPLRVGETLMVEYRVDSPHCSVRQDELMRGVVGQMRELAMEVRFAPGALPTQIRQVADAGGIETERPLPVRDAVQILLLDRPAGSYGLRWSW